MTERVCAQCPNLLRPSQQKYCSKECQAKGQFGVPKKTGIALDQKGYVRIRYGEHKGRREHVVIMEERLGRKLAPNEMVHHKNEIYWDNDPDNLELKTKSQHSSDHMKERQRGSRGELLPYDEYPPHVVLRRDKQLWVHRDLFPELFPETKPKGGLLDEFEKGRSGRGDN